jgi:hypothetical protein
MNHSLVIFAILALFFCVIGPYAYLSLIPAVRNVLFNFSAEALKFYAKDPNKVFQLEIMVGKMGENGIRGIRINGPTVLLTAGVEIREEQNKPMPLKKVFDFLEWCPKTYATSSDEDRIDTLIMARDEFEYTHMSSFSGRSDITIDQYIDLLSQTINNNTPIKNKQ